MAAMASIVRMTLLGGIQFRASFVQYQGLSHGGLSTIDKGAYGLSLPSEDLEWAKKS